MATDVSRAPLTRARPLRAAAGPLAAAWPALAAGLVAAGLLVALAYRSGGYFPDAHLPAGVVAFAALALLLAIAPPTHRLSTPALVALAALVGLTAWTGLSARWSSAPDVALEDFQRDLVHLGIFSLALVAAGSGRYARQIPWLVLAVVMAVVGGGLLSRLYPELISAGSTTTRIGGYRLEYPLAYWNALGAMAALGLVLAVGLAGDVRAAALPRALAAAAAVPVGVAGYLSFSRGAWLALILGVVVLVALSVRRLSLLATLALVGGALAIALLRLRGYPALTEDPTLGQGQEVSGRAFGALVIALTVAVGAAQLAVAQISIRRDSAERLAWAARPAVLVVGGLAVLAAVVLYAAKADSVEGRSASTLVEVESWVDRQWDEFMAPATFSASGSERLTTARGSRADLYRVAIDGFESQPLWGDGAGGFEYRFAHDREVAERVRDAHSLFFETLGELGLMGAALLLAFLGAIVWALVAARRRTGALGRTRAAVVAAGVTVWIAHSMVDWDWQMPALTGTGLLLAAAAFPAGRARRRRRNSRARPGAPIPSRVQP